MPRYYTRFQARQAPKEQVPKEQVPKEQVPKEQVQVQESQLLKDTRAMQVLLDRQCFGVDRIKNSIEVFAFLADRPTLLSHPQFRQVVINKIEEFRPEMEKRKNDAIKTFVSTYSPSNSRMEQYDLLDARNTLYYIPLLTAEINKVDVIIHKQAK
jgi:hypothetical protein